MGRPKLRLSVGDRFGRLEVIEYAGLIHTHACWRVRCDCGAVRELPGSRILRGKVRSCGCLRVEVSRSRQIRHGHNRRDSCSPEYHVWYNMKTRCLNTENHAYPRYGGRGIKVCDKWMSFQGFLDDMGPRPDKSFTLERLDNDLGYNRDNCAWATKSQQTKNRKCTIWVGNLTLAEACRLYDVSYSRAFQRKARGWPQDRWFEKGNAMT